MSRPSFVELLAGSSPLRRLAGALFRRYARRRVRQIERRPAGAGQHETLLRLVRRAAATRFGREHDFATIRSVRDYQAFWRDYWQPAFPVVRDVTWPGRVPYFALSSGTTSGATKFVPVSPEMLASNRRAALTSLAWFQDAYPGPSLFTGRLLFLGGSTDLQRLAAPGRAPTLAGDLSGIATREVPAFLRPYTLPHLGLALERDWERKLLRLAECSAPLPITLVSGVPSWLLSFFERLLEVTGRRYVADVW